MGSEAEDGYFSGRVVTHPQRVGTWMAGAITAITRWFLALPPYRRDVASVSTALRRACSTRGKRSPVAARHTHSRTFKYEDIATLKIRPVLCLEVVPPGAPLRRGGVFPSGSAAVGSGAGKTCGPGRRKLLHPTFCGYAAIMMLACGQAGAGAAGGY